MNIEKLINIERTEKEFGFKIADLTRSSETLVYKICQCCGKEELKRYRYVDFLGQNKCLRCSNKINANSRKETRSRRIKEFWAKNGHPRTGVKHTDEAKRKISENRQPHILTEEERESLSKRTKGEKNPFFGKKHTDECRKRMSEIAKKTAKRGKESRLYGKIFYSKSIPYLRKDGSIIKLRSVWEEKVAKFLDENGQEWEYEAKFFPVSYEWEGKIKDGTYIPDFFLGDEIWEVKGYFRGDAKIKFETFLKTYPDIKIKLLTKKELIAMGIKL